MILKIYFLLNLLVSLFYILIQILYKINWNKIPLFKTKDIQNLPTVSIVVAARNESENIALLLESLLLQDYPKDLFEIIIVDDHSEDNTVEKVYNYFPIANTKNIKLTLLHLKDFIEDRSKINAFKKKAIAYALSKSNSQWIVCTDADCQMNAEWLSTLMQQAMSENAQAILAPVLFEEGSENVSLNLRRFQQLDLLAMMVITAVGVKWKTHLANGANFAYERKAYESVNGFEGQEHFASGDDMLLLQKIAAQSSFRISFVKGNSALVYTKLKTNWRDLWCQRLRWASKSSAYTEWRLFFIMGNVGLFNLLIFLNLILLFFISFKGLLLLLVFGQILVKLLVDYQVLKVSAKFFNKEKYLSSFLVVSFLHWVYMIAIGCSALFKKEYTWKGRKVH